MCSLAYSHLIFPSTCFFSLDLLIGAFDLDPLLMNLLGGPCGKIASKGHGDAASQHFTKHDW
jgi:hypothetical protein